MSYCKYYLLKSISAPAGYAVKAVQFVVNAIHGGHAMRVHADSFLGMLKRTSCHTMHYTKYMR